MLDLLGILMLILAIILKQIITKEELPDDSGGTKKVEDVEDLNYARLTLLALSRKF